MAHLVKPDGARLIDGFPPLFLFQHRHATRSSVVPSRPAQLLYILSPRSRRASPPSPTVSRHYFYFSIPTHPGPPWFRRDLLSSSTSSPRDPAAFRE